MLAWSWCRVVGVASSGAVFGDEVADRDGVVAVGAGAAVADAAHEGAAVVAALFADGSVAAGVAFVDGDGAPGAGRRGW